MASTFSLLAFAALYLAMSILWRIPHWVGLVYLTASVTCFIAYARDKSSAQAGRRRTPENTLLMLGLACGWPGAVFAQQLLRHKSSKASFRHKFWCTVALNLAALIYFCSPLAFLSPILRANFASGWPAS